MTALVCRALSEAHALGLIHRDVKPGNVLLCERGREGDVAKIVDFGLVKALNASDDSRLTKDQALTGTPLYLAPASITAPEAVDARSDLYALGALAYFLLVGRPPFKAASIVEICAAHLHEPASPPSEEHPGIPPALDAAILRAFPGATQSARQRRGIGHRQHGADPCRLRTAWHAGGCAVT